MEKFKQYILKYFEPLFVLLVLLSTAGINYFIPYKIAFLNFYFLPVILGGYFLGRRLAMLGAVFATLAVLWFVYLQQDLFFVEQDTATIYAQVVVWGGFLILSGAVVGSLADKLAEKIHSTEALNASLRGQEEALSAANTTLKDYSENLEERVKERTLELEQSRNTIESMKEKLEGALYSTMDPVVVKLMIEKKLRNEKRDITLLFSDLVNFSSYSENNPPEVVIADINRYLRDMEPILLSYSGHIDKYMGDGIMCEFGAPINYPAHRTMAVIAALKMQEQMLKFTHPWKMRLGVATGPAITGLIGFKRQTYTAIGDAVNLASRLEQACTPGGVLIDRDTYDGVAYCVEVQKKIQFGLREADVKKAERLDEMLNDVARTPENIDLHYQIANIHLELDEPKLALKHLETAISLDPANTTLKLLYAEAGLKAKAMDSISVKGKRQRVEAFQVTGLKNPLKNRETIPEPFYREFGRVTDLIKIPDELILPVEVFDDSVGHSRLVSVIAYALAGRLGFSELEKIEIMNSGFLANIGKESVPPHLLNRSSSSKLSSSEEEIFRQYPLEGIRILKQHGYENQKMMDIISHARERWNGSGYPRGISGTDIPAGARIINVADAYAAMTSYRTYRQPWTRSAALNEMRRETANGLYDPAIVEELEKLMTRDA
jgi:adenylate cyclase